jgi:hypothetical protein
MKLNRPRTIFLRPLQHSVEKSSLFLVYRVILRHFAVEQQDAVRMTNLKEFYGRGRGVIITLSRVGVNIDGVLDWILNLLTLTGRNYK